jgi:hypothetical protein
MHNDDMAMRIMGFDGCELGACKTWDDGELVTRVIYDGEKLAAQIMEADGISKTAAMIWVMENVVGRYVGETTPIVMWPINPNTGVH